LGLLGGPPRGGREGFQIALAPAVDVVSPVPVVLKAHEVVGGERLDQLVVPGQRGQHIRGRERDMREEPERPGDAPPAKVAAERQLREYLTLMMVLLHGYVARSELPDGL